MAAAASSLVGATAAGTSSCPATPKREEYEAQKATNQAVAAAAAQPMGAAATLIHSQAGLSFVEAREPVDDDLAQLDAQLGQRAQVSTKAVPPSPRSSSPAIEEAVASVAPSLRGRCQQFSDAISSAWNNSRCIQQIRLTKDAYVNKYNNSDALGKVWIITKTVLKVLAVIGFVLFVVTNPFAAGSVAVVAAAMAIKTAAVYLASGVKSMAMIGGGGLVLGAKATALGVKQAAITVGLGVKKAALGSGAFFLETTGGRALISAAGLLALSRWSGKELKSVRDEYVAANAKADVADVESAAGDQTPVAAVATPAAGGQTPVAGAKVPATRKGQGRRAQEQTYGSSGNTRRSRPRVAARRPNLRVDTSR